VPRHLAGHVGSADVDVRADPLTEGGVVQPLEQQPDRHPGRPLQGREPGHARGARLPAGQRGPERALGVESRRRDVQAERVDPADPAVGTGGVSGQRRRHGTFPVPADETEREPARAVGDDQLARLPVPHPGAQRDRAVGLLRQRPGRGVQVEVAAATAGTQSLHPQVRVPGWRQQGGEVLGGAAERRQPAARHLPPERHPRFERAGAEVQEDRHPSESHAIKHAPREHPARRASAARYRQFSRPGR
jgi:hypothetical protein